MMRFWASCWLFVVVITVGFGWSINCHPQCRPVFPAGTPALGPTCLLVSLFCPNWTVPRDWSPPRSRPAIRTHGHILHTCRCRRRHHGRERIGMISRWGPARIGEKAKVTGDSSTVSCYSGPRGEAGGPPPFPWRQIAGGVRVNGIGRKPTQRNHRAASGHRRVPRRHWHVSMRGTTHCTGTLHKEDVKAQEQEYQWQVLQSMDMVYQLNQSDVFIWEHFTAIMSMWKVDQLLEKHDQFMKSTSIH